MIPCSCLIILFWFIGFSQGDVSSFGVQQVTQGDTLEAGQDQSPDDLELYDEFVDPQDVFSPFHDSPVEVLSADAMQNGNNIIYIQDRWKFRAGDDPAWAGKDVDDSDWELLSTNLTETDLAFMEWDGIGWFRRQFQVDSLLAGKPIALLADRHLGASEIYLNGKKILELGEFSTDPVRVRPYQSGRPRLIVFPYEGIHTLAVRFINPGIADTGRFVGYNGFRFLLGDWEVHQEERFSFLSEWTETNMFFIGVLLAFSVIHFLLFLFYPVEWRNLYFSLFAGVLALLWYLFYRIELSEMTFQALFFQRMMSVTEIAVLLFAVRFTHSIAQKETGLYTNILMAAGVVLIGVMWMYPVELIMLKEIAILVLAAEILRALVVMVYRKRSGSWVIGTGVLVFVIALVYSSLVNVDLIPGNALFGNMVGSATLILSMSIFLSRDVASTQKKLEHKLREVQMLSKRTLEQERINKKREIEQSLLEAENRRKTKELEEARALQLSMLPKKLPELPGYDIDVFMETATEVGGDYYDYSLAKNGSLILAVGDATGHGMKAGIMVAAAKSYFHTLVHKTDSREMLYNISAGLRKLNMKMMYMGLTLAHCNGREIELATAGMPPALHFSSYRNRVNRIVLKGLPLGSQVNFPYKTEKLTLEQGDVLLLMSDGLSELFNEHRELLGLERIEQVLFNSAECSAREIMNRLTDLIQTWSGGADPHDDITMMVLKIPGQ